MKRRIILICIITMLTSGFIGYLTCRTTTYIDLLKRYERYINDYGERAIREDSLHDLGYVNTRRTAIKRVEKFLLDYFGEYELKDLQPLYAEYDYKNKVWHVFNKPEYYMGEVHIIFRKEDGKILAFWVG